MVENENEIDTETEAPAPPRRRRWLRRFLVVLAFAVVLAGIGIFYIAQMLYRDMANDPQVTAAVAAVHADASAMAALGGSFKVMEHEKITSPLPNGKGHITTYRIVLIGPRGEGRVDVRIAPSKEGERTVMTLTGPTGGVVTLHPPTAG